MAPPRTSLQIIAALRAEVAALTVERDQALRMAFLPLGDNHHNARLCPYCTAAGDEALAAVEVERDALAEALDKVTHEYEDGGPEWATQWPKDRDCLVCRHYAEHPVHRTSRLVRAQTGKADSDG